MSSGSASSGSHRDAEGEASAMTGWDGEGQWVWVCRRDERRGEWVSQSGRVSESMSGRCVGAAGREPNAMQADRTRMRVGRMAPCTDRQAAVGGQVPEERAAKNLGRWPLVQIAAPKKPPARPKVLAAGGAQWSPSSPTIRPARRWINEGIPLHSLGAATRQPRE